MKGILAPDATSVCVHDFRRFNKQGSSSVLCSFFITYVSEGSKQQKDLVLRIYREGCEAKGPKEFALLKTLKEHDIPVPTAHCFEADDRVIGRPFLVMENIAGKDASSYLGDETNVQVIIDKMAEILARIHKLDPNCIENLNVLKEEYELRQQGLLETRFFINKRCMDFLGFSPLRQNRFIAALKRLEEAKPTECRHALLHLDYQPAHVIVSNRGFIVVDWEQAMVGDPAFDVAWAYHHLRLVGKSKRMSLEDYFVRRYEEYSGQRLVHLQFFKDLSALEIATRFGLSPFHARAGIFRNYVKLLDLTFGHMCGGFLGAINVYGLRRRMAGHHINVWSNIEYIQSYALQYLERDRYRLKSASEFPSHARALSQWYFRGQLARGR